MAQKNRATGFMKSIFILSATYNFENIAKTVKVNYRQVLKLRKYNNRASDVVDENKIIIRLSFVVCISPSCVTY